MTPGLKRLVDGLLSKKLALATLVALFIFPLFTPSRYYLVLLSEMFIWALLAASYDLVLGYTGLVSFGQAAPFGIGAYVSALLLAMNLQFPAVVVVAILFGGLIGLIMGLFTLRVSGIYYALVTLAFAEVLLAVFDKWVGLSGGETGISVLRPGFLRSDVFLYTAVTIAVLMTAVLCVAVARVLIRKEKPVRTRMLFLVSVIALSAVLIYLVPSRLLGILEAPLRDKTSTVTVMNMYYFLALIPMAVCYLVLRRTVNSPLGHVFVAIRENEERAKMLGYNIFRYRLVSSAVSGMFAALAGALYAPFILSISPSSVLGATIMINVLLYSILGGLGTLIGPMIGAGIITLLANQLPSIPLIGQYWMLTLGIFYLLVIMFLPYGIVNTWTVKRGSAKKRLQELTNWIKTSRRRDDRS